MANNQINRLLEFANMQMAAEAFLVRQGDSGPVDADTLRRRLELGNTHTNIFTPVQAAQFTDVNTARTYGVRSCTNLRTYELTGSGLVT